MLGMTFVAGGSGHVSSTGRERWWSVRKVREDVNTKAVLGLDAAFVDVLVVVVEMSGLWSSRLSFGRGEDFRTSLEGLEGTCAVVCGDAGFEDVFRGPVVAVGLLDIRGNGKQRSWLEARERS